MGGGAVAGGGVICRRCRETGGIEGRYSFAKTPLKAALAPLATARASQGALKEDMVGGGLSVEDRGIEGEKGDRR